MEPIEIWFKIKTPDNIKDSKFNTIVLQLQRLKDYENAKTELDCKIVNNIIDDMILNLQSMKYKFE